MCHKNWTDSSQYQIIFNQNGNIFIHEVIWILLFGVSFLNWVIFVFSNSVFMSKESFLNGSTIFTIINNSAEPQYFSLKVHDVLKDMILCLYFVVKKVWYTSSAYWNSACFDKLEYFCLCHSLLSYIPLLGDVKS